MESEAAEVIVNVSTQTRLIAIAIAGIFLIIILELLRRRRLQERYTVIWFAAGLVLLALALAPGLLGRFADLLGIADPNAALFAATLGVVGVMLLHFTVVASRQDEQITRLAQEIAMLKVEREAGDETEAPAAASKESEEQADGDNAEVRPRQ